MIVCDRLYCIIGKFNQTFTLYNLNTTINQRIAHIHFSTIDDFCELCRKLDITIVRQTPIAARFPRLTKLMPNLFAVGAVFVLEKK